MRIICIVTHLPNGGAWVNACTKRWTCHPHLLPKFKAPTRKLQNRFCHPPHHPPPVESSCCFTPVLHLFSPLLPPNWSIERLITYFECYLQSMTNWSKKRLILMTRHICVREVVCKKKFVYKWSQLVKQNNLCTSILM